MISFSKNFSLMPRLTPVLLAIGLIAGATARAQAPPDLSFVVGDIKVQGLERVSEGTVYNYLPVNVGDRLTPSRVREAIRALYETGFFRDVQLRREEAVLIVVVKERPSIESFELKGNKDIKTEDLTKSLRNVGLATGKTFDRSVLEDVKQFLTDQYNGRGKYGVKIDTKVEDLPGNRVRVKIEIVEGKRARIRQINVVGNKVYADKDIIEGFELRTPNWLSWYKQNDRYAKEALQGDLEKLRSYYMDRGYANFDVESTQVAIAPEKDDIFITVNVSEGQVFKLGEIKLAGTFVVPQDELKRYLLVQPGQTYNKKLITSTQELLQNRLGMDGYAFAKVDPVQTPVDGKDEVGLTFVVDPGNRVYVRHIVFNGVTKINDEVLRREMRQLEGAWLSNVLVERSKQRLQRLPYIEKVESETKPVPGSADLVDVEFDVKEGPSAQLGGGIGYSESQSFILTGNYADSNFLGTGERVAIDLNSGRFSKVYGISHTDPATTIDGVARTISLSYRDVTQFVSASSDFSSETLAAGVDYAFPLTEFQSVRLGLSIQQNSLVTGETGSADQAVAWVRSPNNGRPFTRIFDQQFYDAATGNLVTQPVILYGNKFTTYEMVLGWGMDSRNRTLFADRGKRHTLSLSYALPGSEIQYFVASYDGQQFIPLWKRWTLSLTGNVDYGMDIGKTTALPPFRNFYAGGPDSVRGFRESRLGPKDQFGNPYGGNMKVLARAEVIFPTPEKWKAQARVSWFYDIGNVFSTGNRYTFYGRDRVVDFSTNTVVAPGTPINYGFKYDNLKRSTGIAVQWLAPLGIFRFSYAVALNASPGDAVMYPDELEGFQFSVGQAF